MREIKKQKGMTAIGWLLVLMLIAIFALVGLRLVPVYLDSFKVTSSLESLANDAKGKSGVEVRKLLLKRLDINMVNDVSADDITISRKRGGIEVEVAYEARRKLFGNLYLLIDYQRAVFIPRT